MATPHVSGAVALLKQAHPNWTVDEFKSALVDTAKDLGHGVFEQGGGRLDALASVNTPVTAFPHKLVMGRLSRSAAQTNATLVFENLGSTNLTLTLSARDLFGMSPEMGLMGNNTDVNFVSVYPTSLIVPAGGRAAATVVFAPTAGARAGYYWGSVNASAAGVALAVPLAYYVRASLALVDDDLSDRAGTRAMFDNFATYPSSSSNISKTLDRFGVEHDILTTAHFDNNGPNELELKNYAIVIWDTGYDWGFSDTTHTHYTLSARDQKSLAAYLDAGGQLWLIGESIAWNIYNGTNQSVPAGDFLNAYMGVSRVDHNLNTPGVVKGSSATFMAGVNYTAIPDWTGYANNGDFATNLTPSAAGFTILHNYTQDIYGKTYADASVAVAVNSSSFRTVFWGFEFSWLRTQAAFDDAVNRTLGFFNRSKTLALPTNDLALELVVDPYASDWFPILDSAWGRPFDNLALPFATLNATVTLRNLGSSPQQNVTVNVSLRDNTTAPQQTVQLVFADVPALSTSVQRAQLVPLKHGYFTVNASLGAADSNATNNAAGSSVLVPNYEDDLSSGAGWNASGAWKITTAWSWSSPASWSTGTKNNANDTLVSPLLNLSAVNASSISGGARLYFRMSGVVGGGDAVLVETRNASSAVRPVGHEVRFGRCPRTPCRPEPRAAPALVSGHGPVRARSHALLQLLGPARPPPPPRRRSSARRPYRWRRGRSCPFESRRTARAENPLGRGTPRADAPLPRATLRSGRPSYSSRASRTRRARECWCAPLQAVETWRRRLRARRTNRDCREWRRLGAPRP